MARAVLVDYGLLPPSPASKRPGIYKSAGEPSVVSVVCRLNNMWRQPVCSSRRHITSTEGRHWDLTAGAFTD